MKHLFTLMFVFLFAIASGQTHLDFSEIEKKLSILPKTKTQNSCDENIIKAIEAVDRNFRKISDTLFNRSFKHTIFQTILIETDNGIEINPLECGEKLKTTNIIFYNSSLNFKIAKFADKLKKNDRKRFFEFLKNNFDYFSIDKKTLNSQPVRITHIGFPNDEIVNVEIDIYGTHFLWTINRNKNWDVTKVESLWVY